SDAVIILNLARWSDGEPRDAWRLMTTVGTPAKTRSASHVDRPREGRGDDLRMLLSYPAWTERLGQHFFRPERAGQPVTFFVVDELLGDLDGSVDPKEGVERLTAAVRSRLAPDS